MAILKRGLKGEPVRILQRKLGTPVDGEFGPGTEQALKDYQQKNGLKVDGIAGPDTFEQMGLYELILLKVGTSGETVKKLQTALGVTADGKFGAGTEKAVKEFQQKNGLKADGMAGPLTLAKISVFKETITPAVVQKSQVSADAGAPATTGEAKRAEPSAAASSPKPAEAGAASGGVSAARSVWDTITSFFK